MEIQLCGKKYDTGDIIRGRKKLYQELVEDGKKRVEKKILIFSGSTIGELEWQLKLFALERGMTLSVFQGDYGRYYEDAVFGNKRMEGCLPDVVYIHTSNRNIKEYPQPFENGSSVKDKVEEEFNKIRTVIEALRKRFHVPIICNNYEYPAFRVMGNRERYDVSGTIHFINLINERLEEYAIVHNDFYIQDINYLSAFYGLKEWAEPSYWYRYKYALSLNAIPLLAQNLVAMLASLFGLGIKCVAVDLDNTLWGGVIGDDGEEGIIVGQDSAKGEAYIDFQKYLKRLKDTGIILAVNSKNNKDNALSGFNRKEMILKEEDFSAFVANWNPKSINMQNMSQTLNIGSDLFCFLDDSPVERDEVKTNLPDVYVPTLDSVAGYINDIEEYHLFEKMNVTEEDKHRTEYYKQNLQRKRDEEKYADYEEYLKFLEMKWCFTDYQVSAIERITQLINKTNQFNLTTHRTNSLEIHQKILDNQYLCIQGSMSDKFGDNGIVTLLEGKIAEKDLYIENWVMSCRVFKRNGEYLLFEYLLQRCKAIGIEHIWGKYIPTTKNNIVKELYSSLGFMHMENNEEDITIWKYDV